MYRFVSNLDSIQTYNRATQQSTTRNCKNYEGSDAQEIKNGNTRKYCENEA